MIDSVTSRSNRRRWLTWRPGESITGDSAGTEPTKPSEPGFDGFDGSLSGHSMNIDAPASEPSGLPFRLKPITLAVDSSVATERVMSWGEWKATALNQLFLELGSAGQPGRITADTIRHGEQVSMTSLKNRDAESQKSTRLD